MSLCVGPRPPSPRPPVHVRQSESASACPFRVLSAPVDNNFCPFCIAVHRHLCKALVSVFTDTESPLILLILLKNPDFCPD